MVNTKEIPGLGKCEVCTGYLLVDLENVQPRDLAPLKGQSIKVLVFVGPTQVKIPTAMVMSIQSLGNNAEYVALESSGPNALDFHIAYFLGRLSALNSEATFHVLSKDKGFDPLLTYLQGRGIQAWRVQCVADIEIADASVPGMALKLSYDACHQHVPIVIENLSKRKAALPRQLKTLENSIQTLLKKDEVTPVMVRQIIGELCTIGAIAINGTKVTYALPKHEEP